MDDNKLPEDEKDQNLASVNIDPQQEKLKDEPIVSNKSSGMEVPFTPFDHTTVQVPLDESLIEFGGNYANPPKTPIGYWEGTFANWQDKNETFRLIHGSEDRFEDYLEGYKDPNFNPLQFTDKFINIKPEYHGYLLASENEKQMNFRLKRIYHEQYIDDTVKNGSWMQWLTGGGLAIPSDVITYIPVISQMKYASWGKTAVRSMLRAVPGGAAFGVAGSLGEQVDRINGNMHDFLNDAVIRSVFATALFGISPIASLTLDKLELWKLQSYVGDAVRGIGYKLKVGDKGEVQGLQAFDRTGGGVSADRVRLAQDKADSAFYKGGLFKIPYIGAAAEKLMSNPVFGSTAVSMLLSPFATVKMVLDLAYDHGMVTKGLAEGKERVEPFFTKLQKTIAHIRQEQTLFSALHMERNGIDSSSYISQNLYRAGMSARQKALKLIDAEIGDKPYISWDQFSDEVQQVIHSGEAHSENAVNKAAAMFRKSMDLYYKDFRIAHNLPEDWLPPITAKQYLMRVYDTNFLNNNMSKWIQVISNELRNQDNTIIEFMKPLRDVEAEIAEHDIAHQKLMEHPNATDAEKKAARDKDIALKAKKKALTESLQNEIRSNPKLHLLAEDWHALSANEAKELDQITKKRDIAHNEVERIKKIISDLEQEAKKRQSQAKKSATVKTAKSNLRKAAIGKLEAERVAQRAELNKVEQELEEEENKLQELMQSGAINRRFYYRRKNSSLYVLKNSNERLKLRKTYHEKEGYRATEEEAHGFREEHAEAYYHTIMNQTAEQTINQIMGYYTGNAVENHLKARTINIPDQVLYDNNFLTKDLLSKVANYKMYLARRTHLKTTYSNATLEGGFEEVIENATKEFQDIHKKLNEDKAVIEEKLTDKNLSVEEKAKLEKGLNKVNKEIKQNKKDFNRGKKQVQFAYEKMMGISKLSANAKSIVAGIRSLNVAANLGFLPVTMITDLSANGLKQGFLPFIVDGIYPVIESLAGLLKTHDSESLRNTAGALNLALHHIGYATSSRQLDLATNPYLNLGRIPSALDKMAHFTSNINLTSTIDNGLQYLTSAVAQSNVIRHMIAFSEGRLTKADRMWLNRYGLNPEKDAEAILKAYEKDGGGTNRLGGYQSNFWHWEDMESANKVADAVFRSTHDTIISANSLDIPMWLDENSVFGVMAPIIRGFKGWAFASLNRYLIPTLQQPDAQKMMGFALMTASAALVSPTRRMARGEAPYRPNQTKEEIMAEILLDSPQFAWLAEAFNDANLLTGGDLLNQIKNDKYYDRTRIGLFGPTATNANKLFNFVDAMATGKMNQQDVNGMASMIPVVNSLYGSAASHQIIQGFGLPKYRPK